MLFTHQIFTKNLPHDYTPYMHAFVENYAQPTSYHVRHHFVLMHLNFTSR